MFDVMFVRVNVENSLFSSMASHSILCDSSILALIEMSRVFEYRVA